MASWTARPSETIARAARPGRRGVASGGFPSAFAGSVSLVRSAVCAKVVEGLRIGTGDRANCEDRGYRRHFGNLARFPSEDRHRLRGYGAVGHSCLRPQPAGRRLRPSTCILTTTVTTTNGTRSLPSATVLPRSWGVGRTPPSSYGSKGSRHDLPAAGSAAAYPRQGNSGPIQRISSDPRTAPTPHRPRLRSGRPSSSPAGPTRQPPRHQHREQRHGRAQHERADNHRARRRSSRMPRSAASFEYDHARSGGPAGPDEAEALKVMRLSITKPCCGRAVATPIPSPRGAVDVTPTTWATRSAPRRV